MRVKYRKWSSRWTRIPAAERALLQKCRSFHADRLRPRNGCRAAGFRPPRYPPSGRIQRTVQETRLGMNERRARRSTRVLSEVRFMEIPF